jgi:hypothetical protein
MNADIALIAAAVRTARRMIYGRAGDVFADPQKLLCPRMIGADAKDHWLFHKLLDRLEGNAARTGKSHVSGKRDAIGEFSASEWRSEKDSSGGLPAWLQTYAQKAPLRAAEVIRKTRVAWEASASPLWTVQCHVSSAGRSTRVRVQFQVGERLGNHGLWLSARVEQPVGDEWHALPLTTAAFRFHPDVQLVVNVTPSSVMQKVGDAVIEAREHGDAETEAALNDVAARRWGVKFGVGGIAAALAATASGSALVYLAWRFNVEPRREPPARIANTRPASSPVRPVPPPAARPALYGPRFDASVFGIDAMNAFRAGATGDRLEMSTAIQQEGTRSVRFTITRPKPWDSPELGLVDFGDGTMALYDSRRDAADIELDPRFWTVAHTYRRDGTYAVRIVEIGRSADRYQIRGRVRKRLTIERDYDPLRPPGEPVPDRGAPPTRVVHRAPGLIEVSYEGLVRPYIDYPQSDGGYPRWATPDCIRSMDSRPFPEVDLYEHVNPSNRRTVSFRFRDEPALSTDSYAVTADFGDGESFHQDPLIVSNVLEAITAIHYHPELSHTYQEDGTYTVVVTLTRYARGSSSPSNVTSFRKRLRVEERYDPKSTWQASYCGSVGDLDNARDSGDVDRDVRAFLLGSPQEIFKRAFAKP